jgi:hypothetical protein
MNDYIKVKDEKGLVREYSSKAILSVDRESLIEHRRKKKIMKEIIDNSQKINELEKDIGEIKFLLKQLVERK